ncbi:hypothetical protein B1729_10380 [Microbacterium sp. B35-04]|jgi:2-alkyl-3-oxoalkanoate reductase|nr:hypothetical protein B1729_10380 [Microbacterium sp. B35-04]
MQSRTLITGATGFVGTAVSRVARSRSLRLTSRSGGGDGSVDAVDVTQLSEVLDAARGVDSIVHCVSYVGTDSALAWHVNDGGTRVLLQAATRLGISNITYVSTTGVYGRGAFSGADESTPTAPSSAASHSRLSAERRIIAAGGSVIRPHLVYGRGDRWFIPGLLHVAARVGGLPSASMISTISVESLASQVWALHEGASAVVNAVHDLPSSPLAILWATTARLGLGRTSPAQPLKIRERLAEAGLSDHQIDMLTQPNWFSSQGQRGALAGFSSRPFRLQSDAIEWYRAQYGKR